MTDRPCVRCQHPVPLESGHLVYCSVCGTPQIFLSQELQEQAAIEAQRFAEGVPLAPLEAGAEALPPEAAGASASRFRLLREKAGAGPGRWPLAVEYALLSSGVALALDCAGFLFAPVLILAWLWTVSAPMLTVSFYNSRARSGRMSAGFAARLGLLTGLLAALSSAIVFTLGLVLARFVLHSPAVDVQLGGALAQVRANTLAQYGNTVQPALDLLNIPEFRVGFLLWMCVVSGAVYLLLSALSAGLTGLLLSRRRPA